MILVTCANFGSDTFSNAKDWQILVVFSFKTQPKFPENHKFVFHFFLRVL